MIDLDYIRSDFMTEWEIRAEAELKTARDVYLRFQDEHDKAARALHDAQAIVTAAHAAYVSARESLREAKLNYHDASDELSAARVDARDARFGTVTDRAPNWAIGQG